MDNNINMAILGQHFSLPAIDKTALFYKSFVWFFEILFNARQGKKRFIINYNKCNEFFHFIFLLY